MITPVFTDDQINIPIGLTEAYEDLARTIVKHGEPVITHTITVGPVTIPGQWVVTRTHKDSVGKREITLTRVEFLNG